MGLCKWASGWHWKWQRSIGKPFWMGTFAILGILYHKTLAQVHYYFVCDNWPWLKIVFVNLLFSRSRMICGAQVFVDEKNRPESELWDQRTYQPSTSKLGKSWGIKNIPSFIVIYWHIPLIGDCWQLHCAHLTLLINNTHAHHTPKIGRKKVH